MRNEKYDYTTLRSSKIVGDEGEDINIYLLQEAYIGLTVCYIVEYEIIAEGLVVDCDIMKYDSFKEATRSFELWCRILGD